MLRYSKTILSAFIVAVAAMCQEANAYGPGIITPVSYVYWDGFDEIAVLNGASPGGTDGSNGGPRQGKSFLRAGNDCTGTGPYYDVWFTPRLGGSFEELGPVPRIFIEEDFFGDGSDLFPGGLRVRLQGAPLCQTQYGDFGLVDTIIERSADPFDRCEVVELPTTADPVSIKIVALNLVSIEPITVLYDGGKYTEDWDVAVDLSVVDVADVPPYSTGTLTATKDHCNGGTFDATFYLLPRLIFTKVADPTEFRVLDTGLRGDTPQEFKVEGASWVHDVDPTLDLAEGDPCTNFHPGIEDLA
ncbi:MAG: hypothetical protein WBE26_16705, partial [Phycisphaerae bacterium]